jgi:hypothetical protein
MRYVKTICGQSAEFLVLVQVALAFSRIRKTTVELTDRAQTYKLCGEHKHWAASECLADKHEGSAELITFPSVYGSATLKSFSLFLPFFSTSRYSCHLYHGNARAVGTPSTDSVSRDDRPCLLP